MRGGYIIALALWAFWSPSGAQAAADLFKAPEGCEVFATVQARQCQVHQLYRCSGDAAGDQWMASFDGQGLFYLSRIDSETRWVESVSIESGDVRTLGPDPADPASFTTLLATGRDDFDFTTINSAGEVRRYVGEDRLTGKTRVIDGVALEETEFDSKTYDEGGTMLDESTGQQFIHRAWRRFFAGRETFVTSEGEKIVTDYPPVTFAFPGDKGYLATRPEYDCEAVTASLGAAP
jgi:hypothetical protein